MSMETLTVLQAIGVFCAYIFTTIALPAAVFHKKISSRRLGERLLFYYLFGNFYVTNLVLMLALFRIAYRWSMIVFTFVPFYLGTIYLNHIPARKMAGDFYANFKKLFTGFFGVKNAIYRVRLVIRERGRKTLRAAGKIFIDHFFEWILIGLLGAAVIWVYGDQLITHFGYAFSDLPVHNYWINSVTRVGDHPPGKPFVDGVYPFAFHSVIYYLHIVYGIDTYVVLRVFFIGQTFMIYLMLAAFLKLSCKTRYLGYAGAIATVLFRGYYYYTCYRYVGSLPQEFGMLYILPGIYFLFQFFDERKAELIAKKERLARELEGEQGEDPGRPDDPEGRRREELQKLRRMTREERARERKLAQKQRKLKKKLSKKNEKKKRKLVLEEMKNSWFCLGCFAISFGMTLATHFYDTIIAALFCVGVAAGFFFWLFRKDYFWSVLTAGVISFLLALFPMVAAFATGTPMQGSLYWAMSVMNGKTDEQEAQMAPEQEETESEDLEGWETEIVWETEQTESAGVTETLDGTEVIPRGERAGTAKAVRKVVKKRELSRGERLKKRLQSAVKAVDDTINMIVFDEGYRGYMSKWVYLGILALGAFGLFFWLIQKGFYGARMLSCAVYMCFMVLLISSRVLGLPSLMDEGRTSIYFAYSLVILYVFILDGLCYLIRLVVRWRRSMQILSLLLSVVLLAGEVLTGQVRDSVFVETMQTNSSITCLTDIIRDNKDFTYTIVSASDERNMGFDHIYHYELITFLREIEYYTPNSSVTIPSEKIYFFIDKIPVAIGDKCTKKGQKISRQDAFQMLNYASGVAAYQGDTRWTTMARIYFWAQTFRRMYPSEMRVYYETEEFVCYELRQNPYRTFNLAVDYEFNTIDWSKVKMN